jgi:hypothetical protein
MNVTDLEAETKDTPDSIPLQDGRTKESSMCQDMSREEATNLPAAIAAVDPEAKRRLMEARLMEVGITESDLMAAGYRKSDLLQFLATPAGERLVDRVSSLLERLKGKDHDKNRIELIVKVGAGLAVVGLTVLLATLGKFDPSVGVLFGTILGYIFASKKPD